MKTVKKQKHRNKMQNTAQISPICIFYNYYIFIPIFEVISLSFKATVSPPPSKSNLHCPVLDFDTDLSLLLWASSSSLSLSRVYSLCIFPLLHLSHTLSECLGITHTLWVSGSQAPETAGGLLLSTNSRCFNGICHRWEFRMCVCVCARWYCKWLHWSSK